MKFCPRCGNFVNHKYAICPKCNFDSRKIPRKNIKNIPGSKSNYHLRPTIDIPKLELKIHDLTNIERVKMNLPLLSYDIEIRNIAWRLMKLLMANRLLIEHQVQIFNWIIEAGSKK